MKAEQTQVYSQMGGWVVECCVNPGDRVEEGTVLLLIESMKMRIPVTAPCSGVVVSVCVEPEEVVQPEDVLVILDQVSVGG